MQILESPLTIILWNFSSLASCKAQTMAEALAKLGLRTDH